MLIGYIPTSKLTSISNKAAWCHALANLFHMCMKTALGPIGPYSKIGIDMMSGNGIWQWCHPILVIFIGDNPEQVLVTCTYSGRCPKCKVPHDQLGKYQSFLLCVQSAILDTYILSDEDFQTFHHACCEARMKPVYHPFWESLLLTNIFQSITPNILHQMLQGMVKHLVGWLVHVFGAVAINAQCHALPLNHKILLFTKGITTLSCMTGHEHKKMCSILMGLIVDLPVPGGMDSTHIVKAVHALLNFLFVAQYESHTSNTISQMEGHLRQFHDNKAVFFDLGMHTQFNLPKLHSLSHYASLIKLFGTTDNYNMEQSERLHIDLVKDTYHVTNCREEYSQMTKWLERCEKVQQYMVFINWRGQQGHELSLPSRIIIGPPEAHALTIKMPQNPSKRREFFDAIAYNYGALDFQDALADFIAQLNYPGASKTALADHAHNMHIPFSYSGLKNHPNVWPLWKD
jgi:Plavaka transposase